MNDLVIIPRILLMDKGEGVAMKKLLLGLVLLSTATAYAGVHINVGRGAEIQILVELDFVPSVLEMQEYEIFNLPVGYSRFKDSLNDITLFHEFDPDHQLKRLPKKIKDIQFSKTGFHAAVIQADSVTAYTTRDYYLLGLSYIDDAVSFDWNKNETYLYTIAYDDDANKDALKKIDIEAQETESLIYFLRDMTDYELSVSPDESFVVIADKTFKPQILYLVDLKNESRENIFEGKGIKVGEWANDESMFVFEGIAVDEDLPGLWSLDPSSVQVEKMPFEGGIDVLDFSNDRSMYFVTSQPYDLMTYSSPYMISFSQEEEEEMPEVIDISIFDEEVSNSEGISLIKLNLTNLQYYHIEDLLSSLNEMPDKLEVSEDRSIIRILKDNQYFDIQIN